MYKVLLVAAVALVCSVTARPQNDAILRQVDQQQDGGFEYGYQTADGVSVQASGVINPETGSLSIFGVYEYPDPVTGENYRVQYVADENGFQPQGRHLVPSAGVRRF